MASGENMCQAEGMPNAKVLRCEQAGHIPERKEGVWACGRGVHSQVRDVGVDRSEA